MKVALFLGKRLSLKSFHGKAAAPGVVIAITGIALSLVIMMVSIAVVTGFKRQITDKLEGFNAQISIYAPDPSVERAVTEGITLTPTLHETIKKVLPEEASATIAIHQPAILKTDEAFQGVVIKGMTQLGNWDFIGTNLISGKLPHPQSGASSDTIIISSATATALKLNTGDRILTHFLTNNNIKTRKFTIGGIYDSHFSDFDKMYVFMPIAPLQQLCKVDSITGSAVEIQGLPTDKIPELSQLLYSQLISDAVKSGSGEIYRIDTVTSTCGMFFNWLELLDTNVWVILVLMACVSAFTLISSMFILILERVRTIGLLKALGATNSLIRHTFMYMAERLVLRGIIIGNIIGISILLIQHYFHIMPLDPGAYYLNFVPVQIDWLSILILNACVIIISWLVLIMPSHIIARLSPAKSIRYE